MKDTVNSKFNDFSILTTSCLVRCLKYGLSILLVLIAKEDLENSTFCWKSLFQETLRFFH